MSTIGATRNVTATFLRYREAVRAAARPLSLGPGGKDADVSTGRLLGAALDSSAPASAGAEASTQHSALSTALPPAWVDVSEEVAQDIAKIKNKMAELSKLHGKAVLVTFGDNDDECSIEVLTQEVTRLFKRTEQRLRKLSEGATESNEEEKVRKNVIVAWASELQKLSMDFRKQQKDYLQRMQKQQQRPGSVLDFATQPSSSGDDYYPGFSGIQLQQVATSDSIAQERDNEVMHIVQTINDLAQVMKDLSVLVIDQGSILDRIDYNCDQVAVRVEEGLKEVVKAEKTQKQGRMMICIMLLVVAVLFMFMFVIVEKVIF